MASAATTETTAPRGARQAQPEGGWGMLAVLIVGVALIVLDSTIVAVSLPAIISDLGLTLTNAAWITSLYSVVFAALLLTMGTLGDRFGTKKMFLIGQVFFGVGSLVAAMASSFAPLLLARGIQGIGGAIVLPATLATINATFRGPRRAAAFGIWGATMASAAAIGPLAGGVLTEQLSWPWIFLVNPPICAVLFVLAMRLLPETIAERSRKGFDVAGTLLSMVAFGTIVFGLIEGESYGWWSARGEYSLGGVSPAPLAIIIGLVALGFFVALESARARRGKAALFDPSLLRLPSFLAGNITAMTVSIGEFAALFVLPLYLVNVAGLGTIRSGVVLATMALGAILSGVAARHLATKLGPALTVVVGLILEVVGIVSAAIVVAPGASIACLSAVLAVYGAGMGLASAQLASVILHDVPLEKSGMGSATQSTFRQLGSALGAAFAGTTLAAAIGSYLPQQLVHGLKLPPEAAQSLADATATSAGSAMNGLAAKLPDPQAALGILHDGFSHGTSAALYVAAACLALGLVSSLVLLAQARHSDAA